MTPMLFSVFAATIFTDSIEQNVETAYSHVEAGRDQLHKAAGYQVSRVSTLHQIA